LASSDTDLNAGVALRRGHPAEIRERRMGRRGFTGSGSTDLRFFLGDVELLQLPQMGLQHSLRPAIPDIRNASAGLFRVSAVRNSMRSGRRFCCPTTNEG